MAGFTWNKAAAGAAASTISDWIGDGIAQAAAHGADGLLGYPMPQNVEGALSLLVSMALIGAVVYFVPNANGKPAPVANDSSGAPNG